MPEICFTLKKSNFELSFAFQIHNSGSSRQCNCDLINLSVRRRGWHQPGGLSHGHRPGLSLEQRPGCSGLRWTGAPQRGHHFRSLRQRLLPAPQRTGRLRRTALPEAPPAPQAGDQDAWLPRTGVPQEGHL